MSRRFSIYVAVFTSLFLIPALHAKAATVTNVIDHPILASGAKLAVDDIRKNIILAGLKRHWHMTDDGPGQLKALQENAKQSATVSITYTEASYSIRLLSSTGLDQTGDEIDRRYNGWIRYLTQDIDDQLSKAGLGVN
jgi:hypothetical protein